MNNQFQIPYDEETQIVREKHLQLSEIMQEVGINCWIVFVRETAMITDPSFKLVVGGDVVWESAFVFSNQNGVISKIAIVGNFDATAERRKGIWDEVIPYTEGISDTLYSKINQLNPDKIAVNYSEDDVASDGLTHGLYLKLHTILQDFASKMVSSTQIVQKLRARKTKTEVSLIRKACLITEEINNDLTDSFLRSGLSEIDIQNEYHNAMDRLGVVEAWQRDACPAVDAGPEKEMGHVGPTKLLTAKGHTLHNDFGVKYHEYCSDIQRMWFFGKRDDIPEELNHAFETVHEAISRAAEFLKPGVKGMEVDQIARSYVVSRGYEEYKHALGHQVGRFAHDGGVILGPMWERYGETPQGKVEEGNVFTLELYVRTKNYGMVSLEEMVIVTQDSCKFIIERQNDWICVTQE